MKRRIIEALILVGTVGGCVNMDSPPETGGARANFGKGVAPPSIPGVQGPYGQSVPMIAPYNNSPPGNQYAAMKMLSSSQPMSGIDMMQGGMPMGGPPGAMTPMFTPPGGLISPRGVPGMPGMSPGMGMPGGMPPGAMGGMGGMPMPPGGMGGMPGGMMPGGMPMPPGGMGGMPGGMGGMPGGMMPGGMPMSPGGMGGMPGPSGMMLGKMGGLPSGPGIMPAGGMPMTPGSGLLNASYAPGASPTGNVLPAQHASGAHGGSGFPAQRTQVFISKPATMQVFWFTQGPDGKPNYSTTPLFTPGRYNFAQGAIYRLKLTHIPGRPSLELYPTLEVVPTNSKTSEFLAHNSVPLEFSEEDFKQVVDRNYIVKVVYLPDPQYQDAGGAGPDEIVSTRLEPGQDPIQEALRRGSILLVIRIGNIDQRLTHSPSMSATAPGGLPPNLSAPPGGPGTPPGGPGTPPGGGYTPPPRLGFPPLYQVPHNVNPIPPGGGTNPVYDPNQHKLPQLPNTPEAPNKLPFPGLGANPAQINGPSLNGGAPEKKGPGLVEQKNSLPELPQIPTPADNLGPITPAVPTEPSRPVEEERKLPALPTPTPIAPVTPTPIAPATPTPIAPATPTPVAPATPTPVAPAAPSVPTTAPFLPTTPPIPTEPLRSGTDPASRPFFSPPVDNLLNSGPELPPIPITPNGNGK